MAHAMLRLADLLDAGCAGTGVRLGRSPMTRPVPFEFSDVEEARRVASLLRRQASAFQLLAGRLTGDQARDLEERAREAIAIASRIDAASDARGPAFI
jgi:hypothetical protein